MVSRLFKGIWHWIITFCCLNSTTMEYEFKVALFTCKIINNISNVPKIFKGTLTPASEAHNYNTRFVSNQNRYRPRIRNSYKAATFAFVGSKVWENIPSKLKTLPYNSVIFRYTTKRTSDVLRFNFIIAHTPSTWRHEPNTTISLSISGCLQNTSFSANFRDVRFPVQYTTNSVYISNINCTF